jgi:histidinol phosphatase-like enzyme (inositol monophosphatase family)
MGRSGPSTANRIQKDLMLPDLEPYTRFAERLADAARPISMRYFRQKLVVEDKADQSPVTIADREVEAKLRALIAEAYPDHGILGEEHGRQQSESAFTWVIDPIDGTKSFITGMPLWGALIALAYEGRPVVGVIDCPGAGERWVGATGLGATWNGKPAATAATEKLAAATLFATGPDMFKGAAGRAFEALSSSVKLRRFGGDCFAYGLVASGFVDLVVEASLKPYDYMALAPVVEGAGGRFTDWTGAPVTIDSDGRVVAAATPALLDETLAALAA